MKLSLTLASSLLCASAALAASPYHFHKPKLTIEKRVANQPFKHPELQKRAIAYLNNKTQRN